MSPELIKQRPSTLNSGASNEAVPAFGLQVDKAESKQSTERSGMTETVGGSPSFHRAASGAKVKETEPSAIGEDAGEGDEE